MKLNLLTRAAIAFLFALALWSATKVSNLQQRVERIEHMFPDIPVSE